MAARAEAAAPADAGHRAPLRVEAVGKTYPGGVRALEGISLDVAPGEILAVLGGSGCGKSTLLRLVAGLDRPSEGRILLGGEPIAAPRREVGLVFQEPRLLPWLNVADNVGFGIRHLPRAEQSARVAETLERVGLADAARAWPRELSGGMQQRTSLARALVARPQVLLLDEPFSALDAMTRASLQDHVLELWSYDRPTMVLVTHDIEEALVLADRVAVLSPRPGRVSTLAPLPLARPRDRDGHDFEEVKRRLRRALDASFEAFVPGEERDPAAAI